MIHELVGLVGNGMQEVKTTLKKALIMPIQ